MIVFRSMSPDWLSNTWLLADGPGGHAVLVDTGGPAEPIVERVDALGLRVTHVLCTHHHHDHVAHNDAYRRRWGCLVAAHPAEAERLSGVDRLLEDGDVIETGGLRIRALHVPGHTAGQLAFVANEERVLTGDTLFRGSVGGTRAPGHTTFEDLRRSIMDVLMALPHDLVVHPGHMEESTIGREWEENPFVRAWRGLDVAEARPCLAFGRKARLLLRSPDYDGGTKCWVRFDDGDRLDVVPGSQVRDAP
jgi:glyoxylase-like metal-dependent hydrolase (beta-lactamase superfamily II)